MTNQAEIIEEVIAELNRARAKFPTWPDDPIHAAAVLLEESGELMKAVLEACYQKEPGHYLQLIELRNEAIQTAAMAIRFLASMDQYAFEAGRQHRQEPIDTAIRVRCAACGDDRTGKRSLIYKGMVFCDDPCFIHWKKGILEEAQNP